MTPTGGTTGPFEKVNLAEAKPRAQPEFVFGWSRLHARLNDTLQMALEELNPFDARRSLFGQGEQEGWVQTLICQARL